MNDYNASKNALKNLRKKNNKKNIEEHQGKQQDELSLQDLPTEVCMEEKKRNHSKI